MRVAVRATGWTPSLIRAAASGWARRPPWAGRLPELHDAPSAIAAAAPRIVDRRMELERWDRMEFSSTCAPYRASLMNQDGGSISSMDIIPPGNTSFVVISRSLCECHMYA